MAICFVCCHLIPSTGVECGIALKSLLKEKVKVVYPHILKVERADKKHVKLKCLRQDAEMYLPKFL